MKKPYLSVVIPTYNEAKRLPLTLIDIDKHLSGADFSYEILVVDDGSTDETVQIVKHFMGIIPNLRIIENERNKGKGGVVRQGMLEAKGDYRLFTDADNSTSITHFEPMRPYLSSGYDVVIGSRDVPGAKMEPPQTLIKRLAGNMGNILIQVLLLPGLWDTQCGFKCFSGKAAQAVFPLQKIHGWGFDVEVLALAKALGYKIKEMPVIWINDPESNVKITGYISSLLDVWRIRFWLLLDAYGIKSKSAILPEFDLSGKKDKTK